MNKTENGIKKNTGRLRRSHIGITDACWTHLDKDATKYRCSISCIIRNILENYYQAKQNKKEKENNVQ